MTTYINPPEKLLPWLCHETSLTEKLKECTGEASLHVLGHVSLIPGHWERNVLGIQDQMEFVREIVMYSGETRCWYARTIVAQSIYEANRDFFSRVEQNGLSVVLFHEKCANRLSLDCYSISKKDIDFSWVTSLLSPLYTSQELDQLSLWVRRSSYSIAPKSHFYLVEIFLPDFLDLIV